MHITISEAAENELEEIGNFIARDNPQRADSFVLELLERAKGPANHPRRYPVIAGLEHLGLRRCPYDAYIILYVVGDAEIEIAHVVHSARDYMRILFPED